MKVLNVSDFKNGWFIGNFEPTAFKTSNFEIALKIHKFDEDIHPHRHNQTVEYNLLTDGKMEVNGCIIEEGNIFIFEKSEICNVKILSDIAKVVCIKIPSNPEDKELV